MYHSNKTRSKVTFGTINSLKNKEEQKRISRMQIARYGNKALPYLQPTVYPNSRRQSITINKAKPETRLMHHIRLAIYQGNSDDPKYNYKLKRAIKSAVEQDLPLAQIERTVRKCSLQDVDKKTEILQLRYKRKVHIIANASTEHPSLLKRRVLGLLREYEASFANARPWFRNYSYIEALVSLKLGGNFDFLDKQIEQDAVECGALGVEIMDYATGGIQFQCEPNEMSIVRKALEERDYTILHSEVGFQAKSYILLTDIEREQYNNFVRNLLKISDIEEIYDNVWDDNYVGKEPTNNVAV